MSDFKTRIDEDAEREGAAIKRSFKSRRAVRQQRTPREERPLEQPKPIRKSTVHYMIEEELARVYAGLAQNH